MVRVQLNITITKLHHRILKQVAEDKCMTLTGILQDSIDQIINSHLDVLEEEVERLTKEIGNRRQLLKHIEEKGQLQP